MARGIYRDENDQVIVVYEKYRTVIPRHSYEANRYEPTFEQRPTKEEFEAANAQETRDAKQ